MWIGITFGNVTLNTEKIVEQDSLPTDIILAHPRQSLGKIKLDWMPQPGNHLELEGNTYTVLERHHYYQYKIGGYRLNKISLYVQTSATPDEQTLIDGHWVLGDATCIYNARSELIRCAVNPDGFCEGCRYYEAIA
jgi:Family of unknown function (DUF6464)